METDETKSVFALQSISQLYTDGDLSFSNKKETWPVPGLTEILGGIPLTKKFWFIKSRFLFPELYFTFVIKRKFQISWAKPNCQNSEAKLLVVYLVI